MNGGEGWEGDGLKGGGESDKVEYMSLPLFCPYGLKQG